MTKDLTEYRQPTRVSFNGGWSVRPKIGFFSELRPGQTPPESICLPHDALVALARIPSENGSNTGYVPGGAFAYSKQFDVPPEWSGRHVAVDFEGVYRDAMVFVNDDFVTQRPYGYSGFRVDMTPHLRYGEQNVIRVEARAHEDSRWYSGAGIYRDAWLIVAGDIHLDYAGVQITTPDLDADLGVAAVATTLRNSGARPRTVRVRVEILDPARAVVAHNEAPITVLPAEPAVLRQRMTIENPLLWDVNDPNLYTAVTRVIDGDDELELSTTAFGFRTLQLDTAHGLRLNGRTVKLRGACIHHDNGPLGAATIRRAEERRIELLKKAGFNAIRSSHNPLSPAMLDACDRLGLLVIDEAFDVWTESKSSFDYSLRFADWWERDVEAMVLKDANHPSVIMYSIGNEIPETGNSLGAAWGRRIAEKIRELDPTRFITNGMNPMVSVIHRLAEAGRNMEGGVNSAMNQMGDMMKDIATSDLVTASTEESFAVLDVAGLNYGESRYELDRELFPNRLIVGTETFPAKINDNWAAIERSPHLIGDFTWTGWDYLGEAGIGRVNYADEGPQSFGAPFPWRTAWCGDIDITGHRRPVSYFREIVFGLRAKPYIAVHPPENFTREARPTQWSFSDAAATWDWDVADGTPIRIEVYSGAPEVELQINGKSVGARPAGPENGFKAVFETEFAVGEVTAIARSANGSHESWSLSTPVGLPKLRVRADRTVIEASDGDLAYIEMSLEDDEGHIFTQGTQPFSVVVEGEGVLQGVGNGNPQSEDSFRSNRCNTYEGRALAVLRPTGAGEITVTVRGADQTTAITVMAL
ncbi:glycoside hydrolase family 2 TIM barrel-domain containing protein [Arthrobacter sp. M-10]|uniref:glycoside hydrolase family 2 TIM barrel-domain containing protein n=1 Tax=Arthrobacter sp. M-10 TaxID=3233037 RepID=UPI003F8E827E